MRRTPVELRRLGVSLPLVGLLALGAWPVGAEGTDVTPLEDPQALPAPPGQAGHTVPAVALRPDGGMIAVWRDAIAGDILGRWFGPVGADGDSEGEVFVLQEAGPPLGQPPLVMHGTGNRYLAVWLELTPSSPALVARPFDGGGNPLGPSRQVARTDVVLFDLAARPGGGYALVYQERRGDGDGLRLLLLGPNGAPTGTSARVTDNSPSAPLAAFSVAIAAEGTIAVSWSRRRIGAQTADLDARVFDAGAQPLGPAFGLASGEPSVTGIEHDLAAVGPERFLAAWAGKALSAGHPPRALYVTDFDAAGTIFPTFRADPEVNPDGGATTPAVAAGPDGTAVVAWVEDLAGTPRPVARLVVPAGVPRGPLIFLDAPPETDVLVTGLSVDRGAGDLLAFGWGTGIVSPFIPIPTDFFRTSRARRFHGELGCYPLDRFDLQVEPSKPVEGDPVRLVAESVGLCVDVALDDWTREGDTFRVDVDLRRIPCDIPDVLEGSAAVDVGALEAGDYEVELDLFEDSVPACSQAFSFTVAASEPEPPPPHPDVPPLTASELPGFLVWVAIGGGQTGPVLGLFEEACIAETMCVSGRVPGRSEVFVRIPGPKPNGLLWPTLVKLTTSEVEVWIEQAATGETRYYRLAGARPGFDELPGLFDRHGFVP